MEDESCDYTMSNLYKRQETKRDELTDNNIVDERVSPTYTKRLYKEAFQSYDQPSTQNPIDRDAHGQSTYESSSTLKKRKVEKRWMWDNGKVQNLLRCILTYKRKMDSQKIYFQADLIKFYSKVRKLMATIYPPADFGPIKVPALTELTNEEMDTEEYLNCKMNVDEMLNLEKLGYTRVRSKIKELRAGYNGVLDRGKRSGAGRLIIDNYEKLQEIWDGTPPLGNACAKSPLDRKDRDAHQEEYKEKAEHENERIKRFDDREQENDLSRPLNKRSPVDLHKGSVQPSSQTIGCELGYSRYMDEPAQHQPMPSDDHRKMYRQTDSENKGKLLLGITDKRNITSVFRGINEQNQTNENHTQYKSHSYQSNETRRHFQREIPQVPDEYRVIRQSSKATNTEAGNLNLHEDVELKKQTLDIMKQNTKAMTDMAYAIKDLSCNLDNGFKLIANTLLKLSSVHKSQQGETQESLFEGNPNGFSSISPSRSSNI